MIEKKLSVRISHGFFERYELYVNSDKQKIKKCGTVSTSNVSMKERNKVEIVLHRRNILEKWYWFICLFNFINFFSYFRFGFYHNQAYFDADHCRFKIIFESLDFSDTLSVDIEIENKDHNEKGYIKVIGKIATTGIHDLECKRLPPPVNYGYRWKSCNICSFVIYVIVLYILLSVRLVNGTVEFGLSEGFLVALTFIMSVYIIFSVSKKKSSFDKEIIAKTVWERK